MFQWEKAKHCNTNHKCIPVKHMSLQPTHAIFVYALVQNTNSFTDSHSCSRNAQNLPSSMQVAHVMPDCAICSTRGLLLRPISPCTLPTFLQTSSYQQCFAIYPWHTMYFTVAQSRNAQPNQGPEVPQHRTVPTLGARPQNCRKARDSLEAFGC